ncbi:hypothetical protein GZH46_01438 [Fragariocoptes setiger]|uniref:Uncharacterized protein n=1 Tax=Fragariocoptes setiger TaxID=1670756 RepID=A0ABQ7S9F3_9ACAR|nr:hypothetical protein GZH46_01438 [Fragariocoptes setiger]
MESVTITTRTTRTTQRSQVRRSSRDTSLPANGAATSSNASRRAPSASSRVLRSSELTQSQCNNNNNNNSPFNNNNNNNNDNRSSNRALATKKHVSISEIEVCRSDESSSDYKNDTRSCAVRSISSNAIRQQHQQLIGAQAQLNLASVTCNGANTNHHHHHHHSNNNTYSNNNKNNSRLNHNYANKHNNQQYGLPPQLFQQSKSQYNTPTQEFMMSANYNKTMPHQQQHQQPAQYGLSNGQQYYVSSPATETSISQTSAGDSFARYESSSGEAAAAGLLRSPATMNATGMQTSNYCWPSPASYLNLNLNDSNLSTHSTSHKFKNQYLQCQYTPPYYLANSKPTTYYRGTQTSTLPINHRASDYYIAYHLPQQQQLSFSRHGSYRSSTASRSSNYNHTNNHQFGPPLNHTYLAKTTAAIPDLMVSSSAATTADDEQYRLRQSSYDAPQKMILSEGNLVNIHVDTIVDDGRDNPFKPGTELSREADIMVRLFKKGCPLNEVPTIIKKIKEDHGTATNLNNFNANAKMPHSKTDGNLKQQQQQRSFDLDQYIEATNQRLCENRNSQLTKQSKMKQSSSEHQSIFTRHYGNGNNNEKSDYNNEIISSFNANTDDTDERNRLFHKQDDNDCEGQPIDNIESEPPLQRLRKRKKKDSIESSNSKSNHSKQLLDNKQTDAAENKDKDKDKDKQIDIVRRHKCCSIQ